MEATLLVGDYLFVQKFSYGYSRYTFPFGAWPVGDKMQGRFMGSQPHARRCHRLQISAGQFHRLHQAPDRTAG